MATLLQAINNGRLNDGGFAYREYKRQQAKEIDYDRLAAVVVDGVRNSNIYVAVTDINDAQKGLQTTVNDIKL